MLFVVELVNCEKFSCENQPFSYSAGGWLTVRGQSFCVFSEIHNADENRLQLVAPSDGSVENVAFLTSTFDRISPKILKNFPRLKVLYVNELSLISLEIPQNVDRIVADYNDIDRIIVTNDVYYSLKELYLAYNPLTEIYNISKLKNLEILQMRGNELNNVDFNDLVPLKQLRMLDLSLNRIHDIKYSNTKLYSLTWIDLSTNGLYHIGNDFFISLPNLNYLDLHENYIHSFDYRLMIKNSPRISDLIVGNNMMSCRYMKDMLGWLRNSGIKTHFYEDYCKGRPEFGQNCCDLYDNLYDPNVYRY